MTENAPPQSPEGLRGSHSPPHVPLLTAQGQTCLFTELCPRAAPWGFYPQASDWGALASPQLQTAGRNPQRPCSPALSLLTHKILHKFRWGKKMK